MVGFREGNIGQQEGTKIPRAKAESPTITRFLTGTPASNNEGWKGAVGAEGHGACWEVSVRCVWPAPRGRILF